MVTGIGCEEGERADFQSFRRHVECDHYTLDVDCSKMSQEALHAQRRRELFIFCLRLLCLLFSFIWTTRSFARDASKSCSVLMFWAELLLAAMARAKHGILALVKSTMRDLVGVDEIALGLDFDFCHLRCVSLICFSSYDVLICWSFFWSYVLSKILRHAHAHFNRPQVVYISIFH